MKVYSGEQPQAYEVSGQELRIHWGIQEITKEGMDGPETQWEANEALCNKSDSRPVLIEKIIGSVYSVGAEIATINNSESDPEAYAEYQAFRTQAKALADGWLNKD
jgi:hypothetical protein